MVQGVRESKHVDEDPRTPAERRAALRDLLDKLQAQGRQPNTDEREFMVHTAMGSFADVLPGSEEFIRRKHEEIELEEQRYR
jgi:hypothetical protein